MTDRACAKQPGKIANSEAVWPPLWAAQLCAAREEESEQTGTPEPGHMPWSALARAHRTEPPFALNAKRQSGAGWPSFAKRAPAVPPIKHEDAGGRARPIARRCARYKAHLTRVFTDGLADIRGHRSSNNGVVLQFRPGDT